MSVAAETVEEHTEIVVTEHAGIVEELQIASDTATCIGL